MGPPLATWELQGASWAAAPILGGGGLAHGAARAWAGVCPAAPFSLWLLLLLHNFFAASLGVACKQGVTTCSPTSLESRQDFM